MPAVEIAALNPTPTRAGEAATYVLTVQNLDGCGCPPSAFHLSFAVAAAALLGMDEAIDTPDRAYVQSLGPGETVRYAAHATSQPATPPGTYIVYFGAFRAPGDGRYTQATFTVETP